MDWIAIAALATSRRKQKTLWQLGYEDIAIAELCDQYTWFENERYDD